MVSVEPSSRERGHLERNLTRSGTANAAIVPAALGAAAGHADLRLNVIAGARNVLTRMRPVMEMSAGALRAQGSSAAALLETLRCELGYEILVFPPTAGLPLTCRWIVGEPLSANIIAAPKEQVNNILKA